MISQLSLQFVACTPQVLTLQVVVGRGLVSRMLHLDCLLLLQLGLRLQFGPFRNNTILIRSFVRVEPCREGSAVGRNHFVDSFICLVFHFFPILRTFSYLIVFQILLINVLVGSLILEFHRILFCLCFSRLLRVQSHLQVFEIILTVLGRSDLLLHVHFADHFGLLLSFILLRLDNVIVVIVLVSVVMPDF